MYTIFLSYSQLLCSKLKLSKFFLADVVSVAHYILVVEKEAGVRIKDPLSAYDFSIPCSLPAV